MLPALVIAPCRRRSPLEFSLGVRPRNAAERLGPKPVPVAELNGQRERRQRGDTPETDKPLDDIDVRLARSELGDRRVERVASADRGPRAASGWAAHASQRSGGIRRALAHGIVFPVGSRGWRASARRSRKTCTASVEARARATRTGSNTRRTARLVSVSSPKASTRPVYCPMLPGNTPTKKAAVAVPATARAAASRSRPAQLPRRARPPRTPRRRCRDRQGTTPEPEPGTPRAPW